jgi:uncharacterized NAD(P)/FAD-binding protein YdhS
VSGRTRACWSWWQQHAKGLMPWHRLKHLSLIGSGLSAVDMAIAARAGGYGGQISVMSTSARWPEEHSEFTAMSAAEKNALVARLLAAALAVNLLRIIRQALAQHALCAVLDAIRMETNAIWLALSTREQSQLLRHLWSHWSHARHRMAPDIAHRIKTDPKIVLQKGRAAVHAIAQASAPDALSLDCTGFRPRDRIQSDGLLQQLLHDKILQRNAHGLGVLSQLPGSVELFGTLRFGELIECMAVPELRAQARECVQRLLAH